MSKRAKGRSRRDGNAWEKGYLHGRKLNQRQKSEVKRIVSIRQEHKYFQTGINVSPIIAPTTCVNLISDSQGDLDTNHTGDKIMLGSIEFRYNIQGLSTHVATSPGSIVRVILFQWRPSSTPLPGNILLSDPVTGNITPDSFYAVDNKHNYGILYDRTHALSYAGTLAGTSYASTGTSIVYRHGRIKPKRFAKQVQFIGGSATVCTNGLWLLYCSFDVAGNAPAPMDWDMICRYTDS